MYFAGYPQFNQSMPQMSMPVNASNQQGSSVEGANTGMLGSMFGMGLGGFGGGFNPSGFSMPQMGYGGMGGYGGGFGGFGGFGMPQMGYGGGFGGMGGYGGYGGFGGFGMPQMGFGLGSFGPQMGFGGYGNYGGFQPPQYGTTDVKFPLPPQNTDYGRGQINTNDMVFINDPTPGDAYIPDETGQYDPNRGSFSSGPIAPTYSEPSAPVAEPLSIAGPPQVTQEIIGTPIPVNSAPINQPRRMRNSMNMGIGSFFGGIGPGNFRNFYTP